MSLKDLKKFIREEIGRNFHTLNNDPYTFKDLSDYDIQITPHRDGVYHLVILKGDKKVTPLTVYSTYEEAVHASRMFIDQDRVKRMNT